jgi:hypothetical protein
MGLHISGISMALAVLAGILAIRYFYFCQMTSKLQVLGLARLSATPQATQVRVGKSPGMEWVFGLRT